MTIRYPERRRVRRIFFSAKDNILGTFRQAGQKNELRSASIMDLSPEGMGITFKKDSVSSPLAKGDRLILTRIYPHHTLGFMENMNMEIKWVLNHKALAHIAVGCEFAESFQAVTEQIRRFMAVWPA